MTLRLHWILLPPPLMTLPRVLRPSRPRSPVVYAALLLLAGLSGSAQAQEIVERPVVPEPGEEVRVVQRGARGAVHGYWVEATEADVVVTSIPGGGPIRIPRADITGMSVQRGQRSQALAGALLGAGLGVVAGVIAGRSSDVFEGTGQAVGVSVGIGLPVGLLIGWLIKSPEWDGIDMGALPGG